MKRINRARISLYFLFIFTMEITQDFYKFLTSIFGQDYVSLAYSDKVTEPGLYCIYYCGEASFIKDLEGTTHMVVQPFMVQIWHDTLEATLSEYDKLFEAAEGTKYQIESTTSVREDDLKRKWHIEIVIQVMEDV